MRNGAQSVDEKALALARIGSTVKQLFDSNHAYSFLWEMKENDVLQTPIHTLILMCAHSKTSTTRANHYFKLLAIIGKIYRRYLFIGRNRDVEVQHQLIKAGETLTKRSS